MERPWRSFGAPPNPLKSHTTYLSFLDDSKDLSTWERGAQLRNACLGFWSLKAELGLRGLGREGPVFFKIWGHTKFSGLRPCRLLGTKRPSSRINLPSK